LWRNEYFITLTLTKLKFTANKLRQHSIRICTSHRFPMKNMFGTEN